MFSLAALDDRDRRTGYGVYTFGTQSVCLVAEAAAAVPLHISLKDVVVVGEDDSGRVVQGVAPCVAEPIPPPQKVNHDEIRCEFAGDALPFADRLVVLGVRE